MPTNARELLTVSQAAEALDKSVATVRRWVQSGRIAHYRIGGEVRIGPADIAALIAAGRRLPNAGMSWVRAWLTWLARLVSAFR